VVGAKSALRRLRPGPRLVVATKADDSDGAAVRAALARAGLADLIDDVVSSRDVGVRKPEAGFFAAAVEQAGGGEDHLEPADVVMVGDSWENDIAGAKAAGLRAVWLNPSGLPCPPASAAAGDAEAGGDAEAEDDAQAGDDAEAEDSPAPTDDPAGAPSAAPAADPMPDAVIASMRALPAAIRQLERGY
jgi:beta-phosphoglucomutase-like phosphatase (HAD superfamily)